MKALVVDASVAAKWFFPEPYSAHAQRLLQGRQKLLAPDLIWVEVANAVWKKCRRGELTAEAAGTMLRDFQRFPLQASAARGLLMPAWELANSFGVSVYDGLYLALAVSQACQLVTADLRFYTVLKGGPLASAVLWVEELR